MLAWKWILKMKKIGLLLSLIFPITVLALPTAKYTLKVVDESGMPIQGANASISFMQPKATGWGGVVSGVQGKTDANGLYTGQGATEQYGTYGAGAEGFYDTSFKYTGLKSVTGIIGFRRWQPWNPTLEVVLKKIKNPVAMYVYDTDWIELPKKGEFIGYDLIKQDWLIPHGKGITADFLLRITSDMRADFDYDIDFEIAFSSELDGIQPFDTETNGGSELKSDHLAPAKNYNNYYNNKFYRKPNTLVTDPIKEGRNYYFRTRCDDDLENCLYGKIYGDIDFSSKSVRFTYYLNQITSDRNVEFDLKNNLFKQRRGYEIKEP